MSASDDDDDFASVQVRCSSTAPDEIPEPYISSDDCSNTNWNKATSFDIRFHKLKSLCSGQPRRVRASIEAE